MWHFAVWQVVLQRDSNMGFLVEEPEILVVCSPGTTLEQLAKVLQQRHPCLQDRRLHFRITNTTQVLLRRPLIDCVLCNVS
jgi:hypothetical protein